MANITPTSTDRSNFQDKGQTTAWGPMLNGDVGLPLQNFGGSDRSIQVTGTFGAGGTMLVEGSNDGTNYYTLVDHQGNALSITAAGLKSIDQAVAYVRPRVSAGDGTTSLTATMMCRRGSIV